MIDVYNKVAFTNPFPGLRSFEREDSYLFFGRSNQIRELKEKLIESRFLAIIGSSGSGKSSLVKAGLIPELVEGRTEFTDKWEVVFLNPDATPIRNLARALYPALSKQNRAFSDHISPDQMERMLKTAPQELISWWEEANLLLIIDQFEELFRYQQNESDASEAALFIDLLLEFSRRQDYSVYVVLTMRSDYLDQCTDYEGLTEAINHGYYLLPKMNLAELRQVITTPISVMGASIADELTDRLLTDIGANMDQLPILQHALMRTWNHWQASRRTNSPIDIGDYEAIGTMQKAITLHAEEVYGNLPDEKSQLATEKLFKALIVLDEGNKGMIRPAPVGDISTVSGVPMYLLTDVLDRFREPGVAFLTPSTTVYADADVIIDLSHERITNLWERLQNWVKEETESAKFYKQVSRSATLYHEGKTGLWTNPELQIGLKWMAENRPTQAWANRYDPYLERAINFLQYSHDQHDFEIQNKEERQRNELRRARLFSIFLGASALISLLFLLISAVLRTQARQSAEEALEEKKKALIQRNRAEEQTREAITQKKIAEQQEIITGQQKRLTEEQRLIALREKKNAEDQQVIAVAAQRNAEKQKDLAQSAQKNAEAQQRIAQEAQRNAEQQKDLAQSAQVLAEQQKQIAVNAQQYAEQQRGKAIAQTMAIQSYQMNENAADDLPALLALEAYTLNLKNGGQTDNPDIFNALAKAADVRTVLRRHTDVVRAVALQGNVLASASDDGTIRLWVSDNPAQAPRSLTTPGRSLDGIRSVAFDKDGKNVFGGSERGVLYRWEVAQPDEAPTGLKAHTAPVQALLTTPGQEQLISVSTNGNVRSWKLSANGIDSLQNIRTGLPVYCARLTPDGKRLMCGSTDGQILSFSLADLKKKPEVIARREFGSRVTALAFSPDGSRLVTGNSAGLVYAWDLNGTEPAPTGVLLSGRHTSTVNDIAFAPNGKLLATCSSDWSIHLWNSGSLSHQQQPIVINDFDSWVMAIRFTGDGKRLVAVGADKTVRIRNVDTPDLYAELLRKVRRNLTVDEWNKYIGKDIPYEKLKP
ncbi:nSTAND1 domain-containing NTPase [Spirosoma koreense]